MAVLLPGAGYPANGPLLHWSAALAVEQGWHVQALDWTITGQARKAPEEFVELAVERAFADAPTATSRLVIAKSFGTYALPWAVRHGIPGIWLTPVLSEPALSDALGRAGSTHLAIGGDRDSMWLPQNVQNSAAQMFTVSGADHSLELESGWRDSIDAQCEVLERVSRHIGHLRPRAVDN